MGAYLVFGRHRGCVGTSVVVRSAHTTTACIINKNGGGWRFGSIWAGYGIRWSVIYEEDDMEMAVRRTECLVYILHMGASGLAV